LLHHLVGSDNPCELVLPQELFEGLPPEEAERRPNETLA